MKKTIKRIFALVLALALSLSLCSCIDIKKIKANHAYYADENGEKIVFCGKEYLLIENWPENLFAHLPETGTVAKKDVPVLLADAIGENLEFNEAKVIVAIYGQYYCLKDKYDEMMDTISNLKYDRYCITEFNSKGLFDYSEEIRLLDSKTTQAIDDIFATVKPNPNEKYYDIEDIDNLGINKCDKTMTFMLEDIFLSYDVNGNYYLERYVENMDYETVFPEIYSIPEDKKQVFSKLLPIDEQLIEMWER